MKRKNLVRKKQLYPTDRQSFVLLLRSVMKLFMFSEILQNSFWDLETILQILIEELQNNNQFVKNPT